MLHAFAASIVLGAAMTFGDWLWAALHIRHTVTAGILHGALICLLLGAAIGLREGRLAAGAIAGPLIGIAAAAVFYLLASSLGMAAYVAINRRARTPRQPINTKTVRLTTCTPA